MIARIAPWVIAIVASVLAVAAAVTAWRRETTREAALARVHEAADLEAQGQIVAALADRDQIQADLDSAVDWMAALQSALDEACKAAPNVKVVRIEKASTGPVPMDEASLRDLCATLQDSRTVADESLPEPTIAGEIRVASVDLETEAGNLIATGAAEAWRVTPEPKRLLFSGRFIAPATSVSIARPETDDRWPWYYWAGIGVASGLVAGIAVSK